MSTDKKKSSSAMIAMFDKITDGKMEIEELKTIVASCNDFVTVSLDIVPKDDFFSEESIWEVILRAQYMPVFEDEEESKETELVYHIALLESSFIENKITNNLVDTIKEQFESEEECGEALSSKYAIYVSTFFNDFVVYDYQRHLKLLDILVPSASVFIDITAFAFKNGSYLSYMATFDLPPSFDSLYSIHAIYDDDTDPENVSCWFHTHGLNRAGCVELEILGVKADETPYSSLLSTIAKMFIERGEPKEDFVFEPIPDMPITWINVSDAIKLFRIADNDLGGVKDRSDHVHTYDSGVLVAVDKKTIKKKSIEFYKDALLEVSIVFLSSFETFLISQAAVLKVDLFLDLFEQSKNDTKNDTDDADGADGDEDDEGFLVKLGYGVQVPDSDEEDNFEHLWFEVHEFNEEEGIFDATLLNEPFNDAIGMHEGDRGKHSIDRLTDWLIYLEGDQLNIFNIYQIF